MTENEIKEFLAERLAALLKLDPHQIDPSAELSSYGLNSVHAVSVTGELEDRLGTPLDPSLLFEYPSIDQLSAYLARPR